MRNVKQERNTRILESYEEYVKLRMRGSSHEAAMIYFDYLHPVSFASLERYILQNYKAPKRKKESA